MRNVRNLFRVWPIVAALVCTSSPLLSGQSADIPTAAIVEGVEPVPKNFVDLSKTIVHDPAALLKEKDLSSEDVLRLQIMLDKLNLGPGLIDGKMGRFTRESIAVFNRIHGHKETSFEAVLKMAKEMITAPLATAIVPKLATKHVDPALPTDREEQAKLKYLPYRSYSEFMSERYHTSKLALVGFNTNKKIKKLKVGDTILVPNVEPFKIENVGITAFKKDESLSKRTVLIDMQQKRLTVYDFNTTDESGNINPKIVGSFPITPGREQFIHRGEWAIKNCVTLPTWRYDKQLLETGVRSKEALQIPGGPNNPVGVIWAGLTKSGIGIHGTSDPQTIGRTVSAGCIRLANWEAIRLPEMLRPGVSVVVR